MAWIDLLGNDIHYTDTGSGDPVVMIHGHGSSAACWEPHIQELSKRYRVLAYDSYDHGFSSNSPRNGGGGPDRVNELENFLRKLGIERPVLMGQSMGGMTVLRWAIRHPAEAEALVVCGMGWPIMARPGNVMSALDAQERIWLSVGESFTPEWVEANPMEYERYIRIRSTATAIEAARHPRPTDLSKTGWDRQDPKVEEGLRAVASALLLFVGSKEAPAIAEGVHNVHSLVPHSRMVVAEGAAHNAYYQQRDLLLRSLEEILAAKPSVLDSTTPV
ncbi:alpha/beta fold hydrolase [Arthrobacter sp. MMS18-M83]|uniref:alpha/beta fold hydrolase n=1 Tax=Arthrobacter sp. MMS18-M83 TaxID=2996261 RepID=UPI00227A0648|nr:alpha/beta hydrolase [Arthrobacter sp. MMS18-M83]WAH96266.1 alpha/beta hydrolase [Arthrobacter sp. MMS18-M83]